MAGQRNASFGRRRLWAAVLAGVLGLLLLAPAPLRRRDHGAAHGGGLFSWYADALREVADR